MAAGTISFFGTRRVVVLPELDPAAYGDKDLDELCSTLSSLENAVVVLGSVFSWSAASSRPASGHKSCKPNARSLALHGRARQTQAL